MEEKKELGFISCIPTIERDYIIGLNKSDFAYTAKELSESTKEYSPHINPIVELKSIVRKYDKCIDALMDIDMECYPEMYEAQEKKCHSLVKIYYNTKDMLYDRLNHLDIYNTDIEGMSSRNGMTSKKYLWME